VIDEKKKFKQNKKKKKVTPSVYVCVWSVRWCCAMWRLKKSVWIFCFSDVRKLRQSNVFFWTMQYILFFEIFF